MADKAAKPPIERIKDIMGTVPSVPPVDESVGFDMRSTAGLNVESAKLKNKDLKAVY